jgi:hypothetical protein
MQLVKQQMVTGSTAHTLAEKVNELITEGKWVVVPGTVELSGHGCVAVLQETPDIEMMQKMAMMRQQMAGGPRPEEG